MKVRKPGRPSRGHAEDYTLPSCACDARLPSLARRSLCADVRVVLLVEALVEERDMQDAVANIEEQIVEEEVKDELAAYDGGARNSPR